MENAFPTFVVAAALGQYLRVKLSSGKLVVAGATDTSYLGTTNKEAFAADAKVTITPANMPGGKKFVAADAIAKHGEFTWAASGKIKAKGANDVARGVVISDGGSTADGDIVECVEYPNPSGRAVTVAALGQTISGTYSQSEVQAISTKVDAILTALKNANLIASS